MPLKLKFLLLILNLLHLQTYQITILNSYLDVKEVFFLLFTIQNAHKYRDHRTHQEKIYFINHYNFSSKKQNLNLF